MATITFANGKKVNFNGTPTPEDVDFVAKQIGVTSSTTAPTAPAPTETPAKSDGFLTSLGKGIVKGAVVDPFNALVARPAIRTGQALGALGVKGADLLSGGKVNKFVQDKTGQSLDERLGNTLNQNVTTPFGTTVTPVKAFGQGGGKQIAGEGVESGVDIASLYSTLPKALGGNPALFGKAIAQNTFMGGAIQGAKAGAISGGLFGAGQGVAKSLQENKSAPEIIGQGVSGGLVGAVTGGLVGGVVGGTTGAIRGAVQRHQAIQEGLVATRQPSNVIEYAQDPNTGKVSIDRTAKEALNQGINPNDVQFIKNASDSDKQAFREMYKTALAASQDKTIANQPTETIGKTLVNQAKYTDGVRKEVGQQLGQIAKSMPQNPIDVTPAISKFEESLSNAGIYADDTGQLNFAGSRYADQTAVQKALQKVYDSVDDTMKPADIILARQRIFTNQKYANAANEIVPGDFADSIIGQLYDTLDDPLKATNKQYGELAQKYAQSSQALRDFGNLIGKNFDIGDKFTDLRAGEVANRALSNASARPLSVISGLEDTARTLGYKGTESARNQVLFANMLEDPNYQFFKPTQITSLRSRVAQGTIDAAKSFKGGIVPGLSNLAEKGVQTIQGISPEAQRTVLEKLIGATQGALKFR